MVHASTRSAWLGLGRARSYVLSTRCHRVSHGQNVLRGVLVAIMVSLALWTVPLSKTEWEVFQNETATVAGPAAGEVSIDLNRGLSIHRRLVLKQSKHHAKSNIGEVLRKLFLSEKTPHIEILDTENVESSNENRSNLIQVVLPGVGYFGRYPSNLEPLTLSSITTFLSSGKNPLSPSEFLLLFSKVLWIADPFSVGQRSKSGDTEVDSNSFSCLGQIRTMLIQSKRCKVTTSTILGYRNRTGAALKSPTPTDLKTSDLSQDKVLVTTIPLEGRSGVLSSLFIPLRLELGVSGSLLEEVLVGRLKMPKSLLSRHTAHLVEPRILLLLFQLGKQGGGSGVPHGISRLIGVRPKPKSPVINKASTTKDLGQRGLLSLSGIEPKLVSNLHRYIIPDVNVRVKHLFGGKAIPLPPGGGSLLA